MPVRDRDPPVLPDRGRDLGEVRLVAAAAEPARRIDVEALLRERGAFGEVGGEGGEQLEPGRAEHRAEPEVADRPGHAGREQRLGLLRW